MVNFLWRRKAQQRHSNNYRCDTYEKNSFSTFWSISRYGNQHLQKTLGYSFSKQIFMQARLKLSNLSTMRIHHVLYAILSKISELSVRQTPAIIRDELQPLPRYTAVSPMRHARSLFD